MRPMVLLGINVRNRVTSRGHNSHVKPHSNVKLAYRVPD